jgi:LysR family glycine cleavage system transcriptional activator
MPRPIHRLPPLNALRCFVVAAKHLSISRAAEELFVTPAAVSQQIKQLEDHLGCLLFRRTARSLLLTDEGQACLPGLADGFQKLADALDEIDLLQKGGVLTVSVAPSFAAKWMMGRLEDFQEQYPDIDVRISASNQMVDFGSEDVDCAIRYGAGNYPGLETDHLLSESIVPVAAPVLVEQSGIREPSDLVGVPLLHDDGPERDASCPDWPMWLKAAGVKDADGKRGPRFDQSALVLEAAVAGRGVALAKARLAEQDLEAGRLVRLFDLEQPLRFAYFLVCPARKARLAKVAAFRTWLLSRTRETENGPTPQPAPAGVEA